mmetsp:Transcript_11059/g.30258  ORF Transcript_11059/g.30258 Transcript_11059/m.30258 type:complete len:255 (+) Transcript_11059:974-1738(+)
MGGGCRSNEEMEELDRLEMPVKLAPAPPFATAVLASRPTSVPWEPLGLCCGCSSCCCCWRLLLLWGGLGRGGEGTREAWPWKGFRLLRLRGCGGRWPLARTAVAASMLLRAELAGAGGHGGAGEAVREGMAATAAARACCSLCDCCCCCCHSISASILRSSSVILTAMTSASSFESDRSSIISPAMASAVSSRRSKANSMVLQWPSGSRNLSWKNDLLSSACLQVTANSRCCTCDELPSSPSSSSPAHCCCGWW